MPFSEELDLRDSLRLNFFMLSTFGYWLPESIGRFRFLYRIYSILLIGSCFLLYTTTELINITLSLHDLTKLTDGMFLFLTHFAQVFKLYYFNINYHRILHLLNSLNREIFKPRNLRQLEMLRIKMRYFRNGYVIFVYMCTATCILWAIFPLLESEGEMALPLSAWYPFETNHTPVFQLIYFYQIFSVLMGAITNVSMDTVASGFMSHICGQLDVLNDALTNIREQSITNMRDQNQDFKLLQRELQAEMDKEIIRCVLHHINILEVAKEVGYLFDFSVLCQFAVGCVILCLTMFKLTLVPLFSIQFYSMVLYQGCILTELVFYCWYGNEIILKSSRLSISAYNADWTDCTTSFKRNLMMIMVRSHRPLRLYAGNLFILSLETFTTILRTSWSYFAVLYQVHSRE